MGSDYSIETEGGKHYIRVNGKSREIVVYPAMWSRQNSRIPNNVVAVSDKLLKYALPKADSVIRDQLNGKKSSSPISSGNLIQTEEYALGSRAVFNNDGQDQIGMTYVEIWDYLSQDTEDADEIIAITHLVFKALGYLDIKKAVDESKKSVYSIS